MEYLPKLNQILGFLYYLKMKEKIVHDKKWLERLQGNKVFFGSAAKGCVYLNALAIKPEKIKDSYLEKFKIYCLVFNNKKPEAQLLLDLLREQNQSSKFYDDKINFLLGVTEKTSNKINEENLLNFYLSSITIPNFKYESIVSIFLIPPPICKSHLTLEDISLMTS